MLFLLRYASVSLRAIAAAAGMKAGSVYYHFDSKQAIVIEEILDIGISAVHEEVSRTIENLPELADSYADIMLHGLLAHPEAKR